MNKIHLVVLWHMHQPQYRDPETGRYVLPWTRLHALKDYWGMVKILEEFPKFHATFNVVPALGLQLEEYASGTFNEPWFELAFRDAEKLSKEGKNEILQRAFQVNHERFLTRWPRFQELYEWTRQAGSDQATVTFTPARLGVTCNCSRNLHGWTKNGSPGTPPSISSPRREKTSRKKTKRR